MLTLEGKKNEELLVQEHYTEYLRGTRIVHVQAESKEQALDNDYDLIDVIEDCWVDGEVQEADTITDEKFSDEWLDRTYS